MEEPLVLEIHSDISTTPGSLPVCPTVLKLSSYIASFALASQCIYLSIYRGIAYKIYVKFPSWGKWS